MSLDADNRQQRRVLVSNVSSGMLAQAKDSPEYLNGEDVVRKK
jgi:hypothetical protein